MERLWKNEGAMGADGSIVSSTDGKEGVDGSSPSEGFQFSPA
jgi:hypothetical protein